VVRDHEAVMSQTALRTHWILRLASACALLAASCESTTHVASDCPGRVCPRENMIGSRACIVSSTTAEIAIVRHDNDEALRAVCLARSLAADSQGLVACRVLWRLGEAGPLPAGTQPSPRQCSDQPFLEPAGPPHASNVCVLKQLSDSEVADRSHPAGWHFDSLGLYPDCSSYRGTVRFTPLALPTPGVVVDIACSAVQAVGTDGELIDVDATECGQLPDGNMDDVGAACLPAATPAGGFSDLEAYVEVQSAQCQTAPCLVYHLQGDPDPECSPNEEQGIWCATQDEVEKRAYCSCRCDGPAGDPGPLCDCTDGFSCVEVLEDGPPGIRGSYCVRNGTFIAE
jgi:hypothetical protein